VHSQIKSIFWSDDRVGSLSPEEKLAILWLMTNSRLDICGFCRPEKRWFEFETGIPFEALQRASKGFPNSIQTLPDGTVFIRNYIRHQCSKNGAVVTSNKIVVGAVKQALGMPEALRRAFFEANPELETLASEFIKSTKPFQDLPRGKGKVKAKAEDSESSETDLKPTDSGRWAHSIVSAYPRREDTERCLLEVVAQLEAGADPEAMLAGTRAMAAAIALLPSGHLNKFVIGAYRFFRDKRWLDDPATLSRQGGSNGAAHTPAEVGGRRGTVVKLQS
jgi:hypothetical protein